MKLTRKQAKALGFVPDADARDTAARKRRNKNHQHCYDSGQTEPIPATDSRSAAGKLFDEACAAHGLPIPVHEFPFHETRKWRFDYLFDGWLALEVEGGSWSGGAHTRGKHFRSDIEKYNEATILGYALLRCTPEEIEDGSVFATIRRALNAGLEAQP